MCLNPDAPHPFTPWIRHCIFVKQNNLLENLNKVNLDSDIRIGLHLFLQLLVMLMKSEFYAFCVLY